MIAPDRRGHFRGTSALRFLTLAAVALAAMLTACTATPGGGPSGDDLSTSETQFYSFQRTLPLPVSTTPGDTLYTSEMWGIDIVEILADGRPVAGNPSYIMFDDPNTGPIAVHSGAYLYNINLNHMLFGKLSKPFDYSLVEYSIPKATEVLVIRYRLVPYDGDPDPRVYTLTARRVG
jgi:hypothetical protein